jgi:hypothetical protein
MCTVQVHAELIHLDFMFVSGGNNTFHQEHFEKHKSKILCSSLLLILIYRGSSSQLVAQNYISGQIIQCTLQVGDYMHKNP